MTTAEKPTCPHCGQQMKKYSVSPFSYSDGLGWGSDILYVCFNDQCPPYVKGWTTMMDYYGRVGSQRYFINPIGNQSGVLPVGSRHAMRGDILEDDEPLAVAS